MATTVERCGVGYDLLHRVVQEHLDDFLAQVQDEGRRLPPWVERTFREYLDCGRSHNGFFHLYCPGCDHHRLVPLACGRAAGFCPSCAGRRMAERAAHWVDGVIPEVPVRQWVLTLPWSRRFLLARDHDLCRGVLGVFLEVVFAWYRARLGLPHGQPGAITVIQRFSSSLAIDPHFHSIVLDGLFLRDEPSGELLFHPLPAIDTAEVEHVVAHAAVRIERFLARRGFGQDEDDRGRAGDDEPDAGDAQLMLQMHSLNAPVRREADGRPAPVRRHQILAGRRRELPPLCAICDGYNLHAGVHLGAQARPALERLCRYTLRPPLPKGRLEERPDGKLLLRLKKPWSDGSTSLIFEPLELLARLAALLPRPGKNGISYHGVLGARSALRAEVFPSPPQTASLGALGQGCGAGPRFRIVPPNTRRHRPWRLPWADLLWRTFSTNSMACPHCGKRMTVRALVLPPASLRVRASLHRSEERSARAPPSAQHAAR
jgi:hypothetical protein